MLDRYEGVLRDFFRNGDQPQLQCLKAIDEFWTHSHLHIVVIFDKFIRRELIHIKVMSNYLIEKLTNKAVNLEKNSVYYKALKTCLTVVSLNRKKLEADNSEKLAPIVKRHKTEFFDILLHIFEVNDP